MSDRRVVLSSAEYRVVTDRYSGNTAHAGGPFGGSSRQAIPARPSTRRCATPAATPAAQRMSSRC